MEKAEAKKIASQILEDPNLKGYLKSSILKCIEDHVTEHNKIFEKEKERAIEKILSEDFRSVLKKAFLLFDKNEITSIYKNELQNHLIIEKNMPCMLPRKSSDPDISVRVVMFLVNKNIRKEKKHEKTLCFGRYSFKKNRWEKEAQGELKWWADLGIKE